MLKDTVDFKCLLWISSIKHEKNLSSTIANVTNNLFKLRIMKIPKLNEYSCNFVKKDS